MPTRHRRVAIRAKMKRKKLELSAVPSVILNFDKKIDNYLESKTKNQSLIPCSCLTCKQYLPIGSFPVI